MMPAALESPPPGPTVSFSSPLGALCISPGRDVSIGDPSMTLGVLLPFSPFQTGSPGDFGASAFSMDTPSEDVKGGMDLLDQPAGPSGGKPATRPCGVRDEEHDDEEELEPEEGEEEEDEEGEEDEEPCGGHGERGCGRDSAGGALDPNLMCKQYKLCREPRVPKDRGQGLHPYCAKHKMVRQNAWRRAARKYRQKKRTEQHGYYGADDDLDYYDVSDDLCSALDPDPWELSEEEEPMGKGKRRRKPTAAAAAAAAAQPPPQPEPTKPRRQTQQQQQQQQEEAVQPRACPRPLSEQPWPQLWFQTNLMRYVEPSIRKNIKLAFDGFAQGLADFKGYTFQEPLSMEVNAAPPHHIKVIGAILGRPMLPLDRLLWFPPLLDFLARHWWETCKAMMLEQVCKDETPTDRAMAAEVLDRAISLSQRKQVLLTLLSSVTMRSHSTDKEQPALPPPRHGHLVLVINICGDAQLTFHTPVGQQLASFRMSTGDAICYTGDFRYSAPHRVELQSAYRCTITMRFYLPGRQGLVRMRGPAGEFAGWRKLDRKDKDDDGMWGPVPGKRTTAAAPDFKPLLKALRQAPDDVAEAAEQQPAFTGAADPAAAAAYQYQAQQAASPESDGLLHHQLAQGSAEAQKQQHQQVEESSPLQALDRLFPFHQADFTRAGMLRLSLSPDLGTGMVDDTPHHHHFAPQAAAGSPTGVQLMMDEAVGLALGDEVAQELLATNHYFIKQEQHCGGQQAQQSAAAMQVMQLNAMLAGAGGRPA